MANKQEARTLYTVSCACGATASLDARGFGRPIVCKQCGGSFTVGWGKDPKSRKTAPVAVSLARLRAPTPLQVLCVCGYRRAVTAAQAAERNRCPGCGKDMIVEKPATAKVRPRDPIIKVSGRPAPAAPAPARPQPPSKSELRVVELAPGAHAFDCSCGERLLVRTHTIGNVTQCHACDRKMRVELKGSSAAAAAAAPPPAPPALPPGGRTPTPPPGNFTKAELSCECGQSLEIVKAFGTNGTVCPACGRTITMEKIRTPQSKHTVIRPRFGPKAGAPPAPPPPKPVPEAVFEGPTAEFVEEAEGDAPVGAVRSSYQEVFCPCGEALMVGNEDVGKNMQCPTCLTLMAVDQLKDPKTGNQVVRVRAIGKMDQDTWSLSDFA